MTVHDLVNAVTSGNIDHMLKTSHDSGELGFLNRRAQIISAAEKFSRLYPLREDIHLFMAPAKPDISLSFGNFTVCAHNSPEAVVIAAFHDEAAVNISAGNVTVVLNTESGVSTGVNKFFLQNIAEKFPELSGFDMVIETEAPEKDISDVSSVIGSVLNCFCKNEQELLTTEPELFFAGYSLCVTEIPGAAESNAQNTCTPPADMTEADFYSGLRELKNQMSNTEILGISNYFRNMRRSELISEAVGSSDTAEFFRLIDTFSESLCPDAQLALNLSNYLLQGDGASFTGINCVTAFVPTYTAAGYADVMKRVFGNCSLLRIGSSAAVEITV